MTVMLTLPTEVPRTGLQSRHGWRRMLRPYLILSGIGGVIILVLLWAADGRGRAGLRQATAGLEASRSMSLILTGRETLDAGTSQRLAGATSQLRRSVTGLADRARRRELFSPLPADTPARLAAISELWLEIESRLPEIVSNAGVDPDVTRFCQFKVPELASKWEQLEVSVESGRRTVLRELFLKFAGACLLGLLAMFGMALLVELRAPRRPASLPGSGRIEQPVLTDDLAYRAQHDALTALLNRPAFEDCAQRAIAQARRYNRGLAILFIDLDRFKTVNDSHGHAAGDSLLQEAARRIESCLRESDLLARWGGDEFVAGLLELKDRQDAGLVARKLLDALQRSFEIQGKRLCVTATVGISIYPDDGDDLAALIGSADKAMYRAKREGKNTYRFCAPKPGVIIRQGQGAADELGRALEEGELSLHYQPQFDLKTGTLAGMEALLRWNHPELGWIPPSRFLPPAEQSGQIVAVGAWTLRVACRQVREWQKAGHGSVPISVNLSSRQFLDPDLFKVLASALNETGIEPNLLDLEMPEDLLVKEANRAVPIMAKLRELGLRISIDHFGADYSLLSSLSQWPVDSLKIDRSLLLGLTDSQSKPLLVQSMVALAQSLSLRATASGVESVLQLSALRASGCDGVQGFLFGQPMAAEQLEDALCQLPKDGESRFMIVSPSPAAGGRRTGNGVCPLCPVRPNLVVGLANTLTVIL